MCVSEFWCQMSIAYQMLRNDYKFQTQAVVSADTMVTISPFLRILIQINSFMLSFNVQYMYTPPYLLRDPNPWILKWILL